MSAQFFARLKEFERRLGEMDQKIALLEAKVAENEAASQARMAEPVKRGPGRPPKVAVSG
jgi:hypothetical protein